MYRKFSLTVLLFCISVCIAVLEVHQTPGNGPFTDDIVVDAETSSPIVHYRELLSYRVALFSTYFQFMFSDPMDACQWIVFGALWEFGAVRRYV